MLKKPDSSGVQHRVTALAAVTLLTVIPTVNAQEVASATDTATSVTVEEVIVTGTRASSGLQAAESPAPIQVLSSAALEAASGNPDLIATLSAIVPSLTEQAFGGDQANQTLQAKLRGLSPNHVLVLVDGKRRHTTANLAVLGGPYQGGAGSDLNFIPLAAIDHVEVLTEGAAAQYGTDAIAGVVNIILKKKPEGGAISGTYGHYMDQGGVTGEATFNEGFAPSQNSFLNLSAELHNHGHSERGGIDPRVIDPSNVNPADGGKYPNTNEPYAPGYPYLNQIQGDSAYHSKLASYNSGLKLTPQITFYSFGTYGDKNAASYENYRQPSKVSYTPPPTTTTVGDSTVTTTYPTVYPFPYGFDPQEAIFEKDFEFTGGIKGAIQDWYWDASSTFGEDNIKVKTLNSANANIFATTGATPHNFDDGTFKSMQWTSTIDINRDFNLGLYSPVNVAFGGESRRDVYQIGSGNPASYINGGAQSYPGFTPTDAGDHARRNLAGYVDFSASPVAKLYLDLAGRYEHYSDFGSTTVGKLTGRYDFSPVYALRGTISSGFRAPTLAEEYYSATNVGPTTAFVQLPPNSQAAQLLDLGSLKPEKSINFSAGFVYHPLPEMTTTVDIYETRIRNRIVGSGTLYGTIGGTPIAPVITQAIIANGNELDPDVVATGDTGINIFTNGISTRTRGIDVAFDFPVKYGAFGNVDWSIAGTYNQTSVTSIRATPTELEGTIDQQLFDSTATTDLTSASPRYIVNFGALYTLNKVSVNLVEKVYGPSSESESDFGDATGTPIYYTSRIPLTPITNLNVGLQATTKIKIDVGAFNLLNHYPPQVNSELLATYRAAYDNSAVGIYPAFSPFGINGGFYYAKATYSF